MRTLAIDLGTRRVGLALGEDTARIATPFEVVPVRSADHALESVLGVIRDQDIRRIVLGLPLNMDGSVGPAARDVIKWGRRLAAACGLAVLFVDERLSSFSAEQQLIQQKRAGARVTRKKKKRSLDALSAAGFLQEFLDGKIRAVDVP